VQRVKGAKQRKEEKKKGSRDSAKFKAKYYYKEHDRWGDGGVSKTIKVGENRGKKRTRGT